MPRQRSLIALAILVVGLPAAARAWSAPSPDPSPRDVSYEQVKRWIDEYKAAHRGRGGKDWDINAKSEDEVAAEPDTRRLLALCGPNQRPVIPALAWEYGGSDHRWVKPEESPLVICVCTPVAKPTSSWRFDAAKQRVIADVSIRFPERNPCKDAKDAQQLLSCLGDESNLEILVDTASLGDGRDVGLSLSEASTELRLVLPNGRKVRLALLK